MKSKAIIVIFFALTSSNLAFSSHALTDEVLRCTVFAVDKGMHSFIPPEIGDTLLLDLSKNEIRDLILFDRKDRQVSPYISLSALNNQPMIKIPPLNEWDNHMVVYEGSTVNWQGDSTSEQYAFRIMAGHFTNGYAAEIQIFGRHQRLGWSISNLRMNCDLEN